MKKSADTGRTCAYCREKRRLTKEHIWPKSIIKRVSERPSYNPKAGKLLWTEMVIADVCETCNSGPLSALDSYGAELYDRYFAHYYFGPEPINFECDYQRLAKWLLKLSFNAARMNRSDHLRLSKYAQYLIDDRDLPNDFTIAADLVLPGSLGRQTEPLLPASNRICRIDFVTSIDDWCTVRLVAINSYYFWILIQDIPDSEVKIEHAKAVISEIRGTALLRDQGSASLRSHGANIFDIHKDLFKSLQNTEPLRAR